ncbi:hypothetical protein LC048_00095 [Mesobacillus subterraneus]|uniref:hypothetical protein n=1 Tax=Mesobacillus subterraneus TaxID=285983 RepID=UPI001CFE0FAA|nr:hypothetical protein [Mesobacillus subterraneus]WLR55466.1 hypothetical protein LC048_00095 [Mesobacillus subterraneus]
MIGIIYVGSINRCPYLKNYTSSLDELSIEYEIISWDRSTNSQHEVTGLNAKNHHVFEFQSIELRHPIFKISDFSRFGKFVNKIIRDKQYEKLVLLSTMSGVVVLRELLKNYKNKYIFDYRDASFENIKPFKWILNKIVKYSAFTSISSKGFLNILPSDGKYVMAHNCSSFETLTREKVRKNNKVTIGYIGGLRESDYMKLLIDIFGNDNRFQFVIHGGGENLKELVDYSNDLNNVHFTGEYLEKDKKDLVKEIDIICYNYPQSFVNNFALANKYYDGLLYRKPLLGNINTYSGKLIVENNIGISLDFDDKEYKEKIYNYFVEYDVQVFEKQCDLLLEEVKKENINYKDKIKEFFIS